MEADPEAAADLIEAATGNQQPIAEEDQRVLQTNTPADSVSQEDAPEENGATGSKQAEDGMMFDEQQHHQMLAEAAMDSMEQQQEAESAMERTRQQQEKEEEMDTKMNAKVDDFSLQRQDNEEANVEETAKLETEELDADGNTIGGGFSAEETKLRASDLSSDLSVGLSSDGTWNFKLAGDDWCDSVCACLGCCVRVWCAGCIFGDTH